MIKKIVSVLVSIGILAVLYSRVSFTDVYTYLLQVNLNWIAIALLTSIPILGFTALRFYLLTRDMLSYRQAFELTVSGWSLNLVLPSKLGDVSRAYVLTKRGASPMMSLSIVITEKIFDMIGVMTWGFIGLIIITPMYPELVVVLFLVLAPVVVVMASRRLARFGARVVLIFVPKRFSGYVEKMASAWYEMQDLLYRDRKLTLSLLVVTFSSSICHLFQLWALMKSLSAPVTFLETVGPTTLALVAGILPFTLSGLGTRDLAFVTLYSSVMSPGALVVLGVFSYLRYAIPGGLLGLVFLPKYIRH